MIESDADRLASIKGLGGQLVRIADVDVWAIFDVPGAVAVFDDTHVNSTSPVLTVRSSDVASLNLARSVSIEIDGAAYLVRERRAGDAPGWTVLVLDES